MKDEAPGTVSLAARRATPLGGFNLTFLSIEIRRLLRNRRTVVVTIVVPVVLYLLFSKNKSVEALTAIGVTAATTMIGIAVYGATWRRPREARWYPSSGPRAGAASCG